MSNTIEELNKRTCEILGMCWHDWVMDINAIREAYVCRECHISKIIGGADCKDFTTSWAGFGILIEWWMKHPLYPQFHKFLWEAYKYNQSFTKIIISIPEIYLSPLALAEATVNFFESNKIPCPDTTGWGEEDGFINEEQK